MISSIVLFFKRDWAGGAGPTVEAPKPAPAGGAVVPAVVPVVEDPVVAVVGAAVAGAVVVVPAPAEVLAGCVDGVVSAGLFPNSPPVGAGWVLGTERAAVPGALVAVDLAAPRPENKPPAGGAAAGVADGVVEEVVLPKPNIGLAGVVDVVGVVDVSLVVVVAVGGLKSDDVCALCPAAAGVAVGPPKREGLEPLSALVVAGVVDSAGLFPKRPPPVGADGVDPNNGFCCVFPKRLPPDCCCNPPPNGAGVVEGAVAVVAAVGVVDEVVLEVAFPKRPPAGFCAGWPKRDCP